MIWALYTSSNCVPVIFFLQYIQGVCIISGGYTRCDFYHISFAAMNCLLPKKSACVEDTFQVPNESAWQSLKRQREIMVWSSARGDIYLQIDMKIHFSYFSFNFSCFEHIESLPVISWFWTFRVFASPYLGPSDFGRPPFFWM